jgi:hypothetical protein
MRAIFVSSLRLSGLVGGGAAHGIRSFCSFLMSSFWRGALAAVVQLLVPTRPTVVSGIVSGIRAWVGRFGSKLGREFGYFQEGGDQFGVDTGQFIGQSAVGGGEGGNGLSIIGGCSG